MSNYVALLFICYFPIICLLLWDIYLCNFAHFFKNRLVDLFSRGTVTNRDTYNKRNLFSHRYRGQKSEIKVLHASDNFWGFKAAAVRLSADCYSAINGIWFISHNSSQSPSLPTLCLFVSDMPFSYATCHSV